jgi:hypothetical protein
MDCIACNHCTPKHIKASHKVFGVRILCVNKILVQEICVIYNKKVFSPANNCCTVSRSRTSRTSFPDTITSAARGRVL